MTGNGTASWSAKSSTLAKLAGVDASWRNRLDRFPALVSLVQAGVWLRDGGQTLIIIAFNGLHKEVPKCSGQTHYQDASNHELD